MGELSRLQASVESETVEGASKVIRKVLSKSWSVKGSELVKTALELIVKYGDIILEKEGK